MTSRASLACLLLADIALSAGGQAPTFSTKIEAVRVDVLVTANGQPVRGLTPTDFEIFDNGVPQQINFARFEDIALNVVIALDMSGSVAGERLEHLRGASGVLLDALKSEDRAALITFGRAVVLRSDLTRDRQAVRSAFGNTKGEGDTALIDASQAGLVLGESDAGRTLLIMFSDAFDTSSFLSADAVLQTAKRSDAVVYGLSVRGLWKPDILALRPWQSGALSVRQWKPDFLPDLCEATGGRLFEIESTRDLGATFLNVLDEFRHRYLLSYSPSGVSKQGAHRLEVRVKRRNVNVKARPGYLAGP